MALQNDTSRIQYNGNNSTTSSYAIPFVFFDNSHIRCVVTDSSNVDTSLALGSGFTLTGAGNANGGTLTTIAAVPATHKVTIYRDVPATQTTSYQEGGPFPAASHERALDKLTMLVQQVIRLGQRALRLPESQNTPNEIPAPTGGTQTLTSSNGTLGWTPTIPVPSVPNNAGTYVLGTNGQNVPPAWQSLPQFQSQDITNAAVASVLASANAEYVSQQRYFGPHRLQRTLDKLNKMQQAQTNASLVFIGVGDSMGWRKPTWIAQYLFNRYGVKGACFDGLVKRAFGDVTTSSWGQEGAGEFEYWEDGQLAKVRTNGSIQYGAFDGGGTTAGFILSNEITIYSVQRPSGGTFKVQYSTDGSSWTDVTGLTSVSTDGASIAGKVSKATVAEAGFYRWRVLGLSGESWIVGAKALNNGTGVNGIVFGMMYRGGMTIAQSNTVAAAIFNPIMADVNPDLVMWEQKDNPADYTNGLPTYLDRWNAAGVTPDWVLVGTNDTQSNDTNSATIRNTIKSVAESRKLAYFDFNGLIGGWDGITKMGWHTPDAVHLDDEAQQVGAALFIQYAGLVQSWNSLFWRRLYADGNQRVYGVGPFDSISGNASSCFYAFTGSRNSYIGIRLSENSTNNPTPGWTFYKYPGNDATTPNGLLIAGGTNNDGRVWLDGSGNVTLRSSGTGETFPRTERLWVGTTSPTGSVVTFNHHFQHPTTFDDAGLTGFIVKATYRNTTVSGIDHKGNFRSVADGGGLTIKTGGAKAKAGTVTLSAGTATITTSSVTANSMIFLTPQSGSSTGALRVSSRTAGTSFVISSSDASDSRSVSWMIVEPEA